MAAWAAEEIGLDDYFAEVLPVDKANRVKEVESCGLFVFKTGDGVNGPPVLVCDAALLSPCIECLFLRHTVGGEGENLF